ncbi:MAG: hypothetical protein M4579_006778 [Chaenotheca gracillima]|nr:MAG: hypothetical protein M4579_006778 [Chaenotheca gracillima]
MKPLDSNIKGLQTPLLFRQLPPTEAKAQEPRGGAVSRDVAITITSIAMKTALPKVAGENGSHVSRYLIKMSPVLGPSAKGVQTIHGCLHLYKVVMVTPAPAGVPIKTCPRRQRILFGGLASL